MRKDEISSYIVDLALKKGATDAVTKIHDRQHIMIRFSNNEVTVSKFYDELTVDIFLMIKRRRAATTVPFYSARRLERTIEKLIKIARMTPPSELYAPLPEGPFSYDPRLLKGPKISLSPDRLVGYVEEAINAALKEGAKKVAGTLNVAVEKTVLTTSGNVHASQERGTLDISVRAFTSDISSGHSVSISGSEDEFNSSEAGRIAGEIAVAASNPKSGESGRFTALLGPLIFADLISQVGILSSAFLVDIGQSFLVDKVGTQVACEKLSLTDDPTIADSYGARAFDDEGFPTRRNVIIEKGVLKGYLHNSITAKKYDVETTGNAGLISPHPWNLVVESGEKSFDGLLAEIDRGIYVTNDWYLRYQNYRRGDFSTIPRDGIFLIRDGFIESSVRELRISDNMLRILKNIRDLSRTRRWIKWWEVNVPTLTPYAVIEDLNFTKSTM
ncbi:TldD/PmbA family protein [Candidatus Bathyarchaeota archaeon]|nr:MAG: TldD/PmbA family protein [Candidatus Bathyarchaeota archaeon]